MARLRLVGSGIGLSAWLHKRLIYGISYVELPSYGRRPQKYTIQCEILCNTFFELLAYSWNNLLVYSLISVPFVILRLLEILGMYLNKKEYSS